MLAMAGSFSFGSVLTALTNAGITGTQLTGVLSSVSAFNSVSSQVTAQLNQLGALLNNTGAYAAAAPEIVTKIEMIPGLPTSVVPQLQELKATVDPLQVSMLISQIEAMVAAQTSIL
jgi:hypothetical protein